MNPHLYGMSLLIILLGPAVIAFKVAERREARKRGREAEKRPLPAAQGVLAPLPTREDEVELDNILAGKGPAGKKWKGTIFKKLL